MERKSQHSSLALNSGRTGFSLKEEEEGGGEEEEGEEEEEEDFSKVAVSPQAH